MILRTINLRLVGPSWGFVAPARSISSGTSTSAEPATHYKITLKRSAIGLEKRYKATLEALGIWRRMQTVYMPHSPEAAGKVLRVKELVEVENVPASAVRSKIEQRRERKAPRGYVIVQKFAEQASLITGSA